MPILMFDKDDNFVVLRLETVSHSMRNCPCTTDRPSHIDHSFSQLLPLSFGPDALKDFGSSSS